LVLIVCSARATQSLAQADSACTEAINRTKAIDVAAGFDSSKQLVPLSRLLSCGRSGTAAAAIAFGRSRLSRDTVWLTRVADFATMDASLFLNPLLEVAADRNASEEARVVAMLMLMRLEYDRRITIRDITGGFVDSYPAHGCLGRVSAESRNRVVLSASDKARIRETAKGVRADVKAPINVQTAAACLVG